MKRNYLISAAIVIAGATALHAQNPTTTYPYLYDKFTDGEVVLDNGKSEIRQMNVHLRRDVLHYIDNGVVKEAYLSNVTAVKIGNDVFIPVQGMMLKLAAKNNSGCIAEAITGDFAAAKEATGAYGTSSATAATMKLTSVQTDSQVNQNYMNILNEKDHGMELPVEKKFWIVTSKFKMEATRKMLEENVPADRQNELKAFLKEKKIKWKEANSLLQIVDFLESI